MLQFDPMYQPYASNRFCVTARNGMVATGSNLAGVAGLEMLKKGGNAVDAAVATAAALTVVEPTSNGLGSDSFALVWMKDRLYGLNSSGYSPRNISLEAVQAQHPDGRMPRLGWTPVMVPGAVKAWPTLLKRFGKLTLKEVLEPAIRYAEEGWPVSPNISLLWERAAAQYGRLLRGQDAYREWFRVFTKDGEPYRFGEMVRFPDHAKTLRLIAETDGDAYYKGEIAEQLVRQSKRDGGCFCMEDLSSYESTWVDPIHVNYRGYDVWEIPPNGQGIVALMALNILKEFDFRDRGEESVHRQLEAMKIAFADGLHYVTDPSKMAIDFHDLLRPEYGAARAAEITGKAEIPTHAVPPCGGTVYLCTADGEGNMVSYIQSNYNGFGSGVVLEGYGVALQNRGADFSLDPKAQNVLAPGKKSYHTIIPGFLTKDGTAVGPFGVMGAYMQPQGHVQVVQNLLDHGLNPQMALDAPRWQWIREKTVLLEPEYGSVMARQLAARGHDVSLAMERTSFGRGQMILRLPNGVLVGGTESRTDSNIFCW